MWREEEGGEREGEEGRGRGGGERGKGKYEGVDRKEHITSE